MRRNIADVRCELEKVRRLLKEQRARTVEAEALVVKYRSRAEAYGAALTAVLKDMSNLGLVVAPKPEPKP